MNHVIKKAGMLSILVSFMALLLVCSAAADSGSIKVGLLAPMTGPSPDWGKKQIVGMELAVEKINLRGGVNGTPVEMFALDTGGDPAKAIEAYREMVNSDKVLAVIGPLFSGTFEALRAVTNEEKVPIIATAAAKPGLSDLERYPYAFRMTVSSEKKEVAVAQAWVKANGMKTVAILYDQKGAFTKALGEKLWPKIFKEQNVKVLDLEDPITFETGEKSFSEQVKKLKALKPDGICIAAFPFEAGALIKEIRLQNLKQPILGGSAAATPTLIQVAGKAAEGVWSNSLFNPSDPNPQVSKYVEAFSMRCKGKYADMECEPEQFDVVVYDILQFLVNIMKKQGITGDPAQLQESRNKIRNGLAGMKMWRGTAGMMAFDKKGDGIRTIHIMEVKNGKWQPVY